MRSSTDGFSNNLASLTVLGNGSTNTFVLLTNTLSGPAFTNAINPVEFRFYFFDTTDSTSEFVRMDDVGFFGWATNPSSNVVAVTLTASDPTASESGGDYGAFTLTRSGDTNGTLSVSYTISGTASNGVDYQFLSGNTNFAPGVTNLVLAVIPIDDLQPEPAETVILTLNPSAAYVIAGTNTAAVTIADDNDPSEATVAATGPLAFESPVSMAGTFTISRAQGDTNSSVSVQLAFSGTASNGLDYVASATNSILFGPGVLSRTVAITPVNDSLLEGSETVTLTLLPGAGYTVGAASAATITIFDDESAPTASLLLEAENFANPGGWVVDQQFMDIMGSSYLLAHGLGTPVADARTTAQFPAMGVYRLWVRTKDWTAPLPDHPGSFKVAVDGMEVPMVFGTAGTGWLWQDGGLVLITNLTPEIRLKDQTGFEGRCDALFFAANPAFVPTNEVPALTEWRRAQLGLPAEPPSAGDFDLVVVGGGIAGTAAAIAAARQGLRVALLQDRPWLGGNASQEIRVSTQGTVLNSIVDEINSAPHGNGADQAISDDLTRHQVVQNETNIQLFLQWRAFRANTNNSRITSLDARQTRTGEERRFHAPLFLDSTGDGWIGFWAGALYRAGREARTEFNEPLAPTNSDAMTLGSTLMWRSRDAGHAVAFPAVPWATNVSKDYVVTSADWNWEYGLNRDTIRDAEEIRDHLFQAIYGTFSNAKKNAGNANLELSWVPYVAGKRESRRLVGDYILTEADVRNHPVFPDSVAMGSWSIDLHYTQAGAYDFLTYADQRGVAEYWIPFRCLYSTNVENLMMAGRCLSATHVGLGSPRVMNTCGQMGVATGIAAALCKKHNTTPRGVYQSHAPELRSLLGVAPTSDLPTNTVTILDNSDTNHVEITGAWTASSSVNGYYGYDYLHDGNAGKGAKSVLFRPNVPVDGNYRIYLRWTADANRASSVPIDINARNGTYTLYVDQRWNLGAWYLLGTYSFAAGTNGTIVIRTTGTTGYVIADAVAVAADFSPDPRFSGEPWQDDNADGVCNYVEWLQSQNLLVFASVTAAINGSSVLDCAHAAIAPSTVNFTVQASDYCALSGVPVVTVANSTNTATALPTGEDPPGTHHYTWSVDSTTAPGTWQVSVVGTNELGAAATNSFSLCVSPPLCVVTGRVELERFQGASRTVTFVASGGNVALQTNQLSLAFTSGAAPYSLMVPTNTTLLSAKTAGNLRRRLAVTFAGAQAQVNFLLAAGDIDNSNRVDFDDYLQLLAFWYQANAATDLDGNGLVDIEDYFLLASHWYETGDAP